MAGKNLGHKAYGALFAICVTGVTGGEYSEKQYICVSKLGHYGKKSSDSQPQQRLITVQIRNKYGKHATLMAKNFLSFQICFSCYILGHKYNISPKISSFPF